MPIYIPDYNHLLIRKHMLSDNVRTRAFCDAIAKSVKKDAVVIDLDAGTGILALAAARAGARKVWAIERKRIAKVAKKVVHDNGLGHVISVLQSDSRELAGNR
jgi:predicted RNA methylase